MFAVLTKHSTQNTLIHQHGCNNQKLMIK